MIKIKKRASCVSFSTAIKDFLLVILILNVEQRGRDIGGLWWGILFYPCYSFLLVCINS